MALFYQIMPIGDIAKHETPSASTASEGKANRPEERSCRISLVA